MVLNARPQLGAPRIIGFSRGDYRKREVKRKRDGRWIVVGYFTWNIIYLSIFGLIWVYFFNKSNPIRWFL